MILTVNIPQRGQKLTNGDVIMALFPKTKVREKFTDGKNNGYEIDMHITDVSPHVENIFRFWCPNSWWNGIYCGGGDNND